VNGGKTKKKKRSDVGPCKAPRLDEWGKKKAVCQNGHGGAKRRAQQFATLDGGWRKPWGSMIAPSRKPLRPLLDPSRWEGECKNSSTTETRE
jgi:hypothetical protein